MSLGIYVEVAACEHCHRGKETIFECSPTYNFGEMLGTAAIEAGVISAPGRMLEGIEGPAKNYIGKLGAILSELIRHPDKYRAMNPSNGWGKYDELVPCLSLLLDSMIAYPDATIRTWR